VRWALAELLAPEVSPVIQTSAKGSLLRSGCDLDGFRGGGVRGEQIEAANRSGKTRDRPFAAPNTCVAKAGEAEQQHGPGRRLRDAAHMREEAYGVAVGFIAADRNQLQPCEPLPVHRRPEEPKFR
jgi:hypothetical protein